MKYISIVLISFIFFSCSTAKKAETTFPSKEKEAEAPSYDTLLFKNNLKTLKLMSSVKVDVKGNVTNAKAKILISGSDSISLTLYGPFGVTLGKLYSNKDYFVFYNVFENEMTEGVPSKENFKRIINLDFSFEDAVRLLRAEPPGDLERYKFEKDGSATGRLFKLLEEDYVTFALYDQTDANLLQIQRKNLEGILTANIYYSKYSKLKGVNYPSSIVVKYPEEDTEITFTSSDIEINMNLNETFRFNIPSSVKRKSINSR